MIGYQGYQSWKHQDCFPVTCKIEINWIQNDVNKSDLNFADVQANPT